MFVPKNPWIYTWGWSNPTYYLHFKRNQASVSKPKGGGEIQKGRHLKEAFNIYPHPAPNQPTKKHGYKTTDVNSMHHKMRCYHMTRKPAMFALGKRPKSIVFIRLTVWVHTVLPCYLRNKGTPLVEKKSRSNLNKFLFVVVKSNVYQAAFQPLSPFLWFLIFTAKASKVMTMLIVHVLEWIRSNSFLLSSHI